MPSSEIVVFVDLVRLASKEAKVVARKVQAQAKRMASALLVVKLVTGKVMLNALQQARALAKERRQSSQDQCRSLQLHRRLPHQSLRTTGVKRSWLR